jgi:hypothetical protein
VIAQPASVPEPHHPPLPRAIGGDRLRWRAEAGPGAALTLTTPACEKVYRAGPGDNLDEIELAEADQILVLI